jgi:hypothetical protein
MNEIPWKDQDEYGQVIKLVESHGGTMKWQPRPPGGLWILNLHGRTLEVRIPNHVTNDLDRLYVEKNPNPGTGTWEDFTCTLLPDAFWRLVALFSE